MRADLLSPHLTPDEIELMFTEAWTSPSQIERIQLHLLECVECRRKLTARDVVEAAKKARVRKNDSIQPRSEPAVNTRRPDPSLPDDAELLRLRLEYRLAFEEYQNQIRETESLIQSVQAPLSSEDLTALISQQMSERNAFADYVAARERYIAFVFDRIGATTSDSENSR